MDTILTKLTKEEKEAKKYDILTKEDLYMNQYDHDTLKYNIYALNLLDILKTQKLTASFCVKYILNVEFHLTYEEQQINIDTIKKYQPHISIDELNACLDEFQAKKSIGIKPHSVPDFFAFMEAHS